MAVAVKMANVNTNIETSDDSEITFGSLPTAKKVGTTELYTTHVESSDAFDPRASPTSGLKRQERANKRTWPKSPRSSGGHWSNKVCSTRRKLGSYEQKFRISSHSSRAKCSPGSLRQLNPCGPSPHQHVSTSRTNWRTAWTRSKPWLK